MASPSALPTFPFTVAYRILHMWYHILGRTAPTTLAPSTSHGPYDDASAAGTESVRVYTTPPVSPSPSFYTCYEEAVVALEQEEDVHGLQSGDLESPKKDLEVQTLEVEDLK
ncbi:hypothetical protein Moror_16907 [Moniliophthora roreri MCA 2997]|nr:hypothetical protein Moror_16907 [Moniliophthora roreri MCA 2997]